MPQIAVLALLRAISTHSHGFWTDQKLEENLSETICSDWGWLSSWCWVVINGRLLYADGVSFSYVEQVATGTHSPYLCGDINQLPTSWVCSPSFHHTELLPSLAGLRALGDSSASTPTLHRSLCSASSFYMSSENSNSGPHACIERCLGFFSK